jgi:hypothetical protein
MFPLFKMPISILFCEMLEKLSAQKSFAGAARPGVGVP